MRRAFSLLILAAMSACGNHAAVPDSVDADVDASSCACSTLVAEQLIRHPYPVFSSGGSGNECEFDELLIGGGCALDASLDGSVAFRAMGFRSSDPQGWRCSWGNSSGQNVWNTNTAVCLTKRFRPDEGCSCDPIEQRIVRVEQAGTVAPNALTTVMSECRNGGVLIGGSCDLEFAMFGDDRPIRLISRGFAADGTWECLWNNPTETVSRTGVATAVCLQPPSPSTAPEAEPLAERIVQVQRTVELPSNNVYLDDVTCDAGDFLLWGACQLASPDSSIRDVGTLRAGFLDPAQNRPNTWQCGWHNPTDLTPAATLTAVCLKPPVN